MTNGCLQGKLQDPGTQIIQDADCDEKGDGDDGYAHLEDGFDSAPARVAPHVNHHGEAQLAHILAGQETSC